MPGDATREDLTHRQRPKSSGAAFDPADVQGGGEQLISQMPKRSLAEALEMKERMLGRL